MSTESSGRTRSDSSTTPPTPPPVTAPEDHPVSQPITPSPPATKPPTEIQGVADKIQKHWVVLLLLWTIATIGLTWTAAQNILVAPKDNEIHALQKQVDDLKSAPKSNPEVFSDRQVLVARESITTTDGVLQVRVVDFHEALQEAALVVTEGSAKPKTFNDVHVGDRLTVGSYYIDLNSVTDFGITLRISRPATH